MQRREPKGFHAAPLESVEPTISSTLGVGFSSNTPQRVLDASRSKSAVGASLEELGSVVSTARVFDDAAATSLAARSNTTRMPSGRTGVPASAAAATSTASTDVPLDMTKRRVYAATSSPAAPPPPNFPRLVTTGANAMTSSVNWRPTNHPYLQYAILSSDAEQRLGTRDACHSRLIARCSRPLMNGTLASISVHAVTSTQLPASSGSTVELVNSNGASAFAAALDAARTARSSTSQSRSSGEPHCLTEGLFLTNCWAMVYDGVAVFDRIIAFMDSGTAVVYCTLEICIDSEPEMLGISKDLLGVTLQRPAYGSPGGIFWSSAHLSHQPAADIASRGPASVMNLTSPLAGRRSAANPQHYRQLPPPPPFQPSATKNRPSVASANAQVLKRPAVTLHPETQVSHARLGDQHEHGETSNAHSLTNGLKDSGKPKPSTSHDNTSTRPAPRTIVETKAAASVQPTGTTKEDTSSLRCSSAPAACEPNRTAVHSRGFAATAAAATSASVIEGNDSHPKRARDDRAGSSTPVFVGGAAAAQQASPGATKNSRTVSPTHLRMMLTEIAVDIVQTHEAQEEAAEFLRMDQVALRSALCGSRRTPGATNGGHPTEEEVNALRMAALQRDAEMSSNGSSSPDLDPITAAQLAQLDEIIAEIRGMPSGRGRPSTSGGNSVASMQGSSGRGRGRGRSSR